MQDTVEQKEALVAKLHRKLRQVSTKGGPSAGSDSESENDRGWSGEQVSYFLVEFGNMNARMQCIN